jgi:uncharacterized membrane protein YphA (DoxX/SURF4 family)
MKVIQICSIVLARFILSSIFLASAMGKIFHWQETEHSLIDVLSEWQNYVSFSEGLSNFIGALTPWSALLLLFGTLLELSGGLLVLLGIREKLGAGLLLLFLIPTTILFHQFWFIEGSARELQTVMFLKNLAIMGGLIMILIHGAQASSREGGISPLSMG